MSKVEIIYPYDGQKIFEYTPTSLKDSEVALNLLHTEGMEKQKGLTNFKRSQMMEKLSQLLFEKRDQIAKLITLETGKVISESRNEVDRAILTAKICAEEAKRIHGEVHRTNSFNEGNPFLSIKERKPYGVVFCITPFNFPLNLAMHKIGPSLVAGNTVLYKPSDINYKLAETIVDLFYQAGVPKECLQMICPSVESLNSLVKSDSIKVINFTGGTKTADHIARLAGRKKLLLELGGNDALAIFPGANLNKVANVAIYGRFGTCGQKCIANKRVYVHESIYDEFKSFVTQYASDFNYNFPDNPMENGAKLGPLVNEEMAKNVEALVNRAIANKANLLVGHERKGAFYKATVLENVLDEEELIKEETFGPVLTLSKFSTEAELIRRINSSRYGLQAGVYTNDLEQVKRLYEKIEVGTLYINQGPTNRDEYLPFGGVKDSGIGREGVKSAIEELTYVKQLII